MKIVVTNHAFADPSIEERVAAASGAGIVTAPAKDPATLAESDLVTLHCPSLPETKGMIDAAILTAAKRGPLLVNLSRGDLVVPDALVAALDSGQVAGAALDVFSPEPIPAGTRGGYGRAVAIATNTPGSQP